MGPPAPPPNKNAGKGKTSLAAKPGTSKAGGASETGPPNNKRQKDSNATSAPATASTTAETTVDLNVTTSSESADGSCRCKDVPTEFYTIEQVNIFAYLLVRFYSIALNLTVNS